MPVVANKSLVRKFWPVFAIAMVFLVVFVLLRRMELVDTKEEDARQNLLMIKLVLTKFKEEHGRYPTEEAGLRSLVDSSPQGKYFPNEYVLRDPWHHEVVYRLYKSAEKEGFLIYSLGPSGIDKGGQGDNIAVHGESKGPN